MNYDVRSLLDCGKKVANYTGHALFSLLPGAYTYNQMKAENRRFSLQAVNDGVRGFSTSNRETREDIKRKNFDEALEGETFRLVSMGIGVLTGLGIGPYAGLIFSLPGIAITIHNSLSYLSSLPSQQRNSCEYLQLLEQNPNLNPNTLSLNNNGPEDDLEGRLSIPPNSP